MGRIALGGRRLVVGAALLALLAAAAVTWAGPRLAQAPAEEPEAPPPTRDAAGQPDEEPAGPAEAAPPEEGPEAEPAPDEEEPDAPPPGEEATDEGEEPRAEEEAPPVEPPEEVAEPPPAEEPEEPLPASRSFEQDIEALVPPSAPTGAEAAALRERLSILEHNAALDKNEITSSLNAVRINFSQARRDGRRLLLIRATELPRVRAGDRTDAEGEALLAELGKLADRHRQLYRRATTGRRSAEPLVRQCERDQERGQLLLERLQAMRAGVAEAQQAVKELDDRAKKARRLYESWIEARDQARANFTLASDLTDEMVRAIEEGRQRSLGLRSEQRIGPATLAQAAADLQALASWSSSAVAALPARIGAMAGTLGDLRSFVRFGLRVVGITLVIMLALWGLPKVEDYIGERLKPPIEEAEEGAWRPQAARSLARAVLLFVAASALLQVAGVPTDWMLLLLAFVGGWAAYGVVENVAELLFAPTDPAKRQVSCADEQAQHLYRTIRRLALLSALLLPPISAFAIFGYQQADVAALPKIVYGAIALWLVFSLTAREGGLRGLVPEEDTLRNRMLRRVASAAPVIFVLGGMAILVAYALSYTNLANTLFRAVPVAAVAISVAWALHRAYARNAGRYVDSHPQLEGEGIGLPTVLREGWALFAVVEVLVLAGVALWTVLAVAKVPTRHLRELEALMARPFVEVKGAQVSAHGLLAAASAIVFGLLVAKLLRGLLQTSARLQERLDPGVHYALTTFAYYAMVVVTVLWALPAAGFDLSILAVFAGVAGIGVGFGLKDIANNFISGLILLIQQPIKVGQLIEIGGLRGTVTEIDIRTTTIRTPQNHYIIVPNADFMTQRVTNVTAKDPKVRLDIGIGVAYGSDLDLVKKLLLQVAAEHPNIIADPEPEVWLTEFADSSVNFRLMGWLAQPTGLLRTQSQVYFSVAEAFDKHGVEIPFPQRDVHIRSDATREGPPQS
ncbi:MAG: mechanosensitive ion channel domain-containing protein [Armatimonadota bacterium]